MATAPRKPEERDRGPISTIIDRNPQCNRKPLWCLDPDVLAYLGQRRRAREIVEGGCASGGPPGPPEERPPPSELPWCTNRIRAGLLQSAVPPISLCNLRACPERSSDSRILQPILASTRWFAKRRDRLVEPRICSVPGQGRLYLAAHAIPRLSMPLSFAKPCPRSNVATPLPGGRRLGSDLRPLLWWYQHPRGSVLPMPFCRRANTGGVVYGVRSYRGDAGLLACSNSEGTREASVALLLGKIGRRRFRL